MRVYLYGTGGPRVSPDVLIGTGRRTIHELEGLVIEGELGYPMTGDMSPEDKMARHRTVDEETACVRLSNLVIARDKPYLFTADVEFFGVGGRIAKLMYENGKNNFYPRALSTGDYVSEIVTWDLIPKAPPVETGIGYFANDGSIRTTPWLRQV